jgi:hypothetical protein
MQNSNSASNNERFDTDPLDEALHRASAGRKLVIYERETGLFADWYIALRCEEECYRAQRYQRPLSIAVVEPEHRSETWTVAEQITSALEKRLRKADLPGYLGNARFVLVMPGTDRDDASYVLQRIEGDVAEMQWGVAAFPQDGSNFDQLYDVAARRLDSEAGPGEVDQTRVERVKLPTQFRIDREDPDLRT